MKNATKTAQELVDELRAMIEQTEELLELHDQIMALLSELSKTSRRAPMRDGK